MLIKFADFTKLSDNVNVPETRNKIQGDLEKIDQFSKGQYKMGGEKKFKHKYGRGEVTQEMLL